MKSGDATTGLGPAARRRAYQGKMKRDQQKKRRHLAKGQTRPAPRLCTCSVRLWSCAHLPGCPQGIDTGPMYANWDEVPNDTLLPLAYEERNGHPPPVCERGHYLYEFADLQCRVCALREQE
jgi:hypothetical protein